MGRDIKEVTKERVSIVGKLDINEASKDAQETEKEKGGKEGGIKGASGGCFNCGEVGHWKWECPKAKGKGNGPTGGKTGLRTLGEEGDGSDRVIGAFGLRIKEMEMMPKKIERLERGRFDVARRRR